MLTSAPAESPRAPTTGSSGETLAMDLTIAPHTPDPSTCAESFEGGELVDFSGDRFAAHASVTLTIQPGTLHAVSYQTTAGASGHIKLTVRLAQPFPSTVLAGMNVGYAEATGAGGYSTRELDNVMFGIGSADANCGATPTPSAGVGITDDGSAQCLRPEPGGVHCVDGVIGNLQVGSTYTVTEVEPPPGYAAAAPQTFVVGAGNDPVFVRFTNHYAGPPLESRVGISFRVLDGGDTTGAVFAITGPGLPSIVGNLPNRRTFAELDATGPYGEITCVADEPSGVRCEDGLILGLHPNATYTVVEIVATPGAAVLPPQSFTTSNLGGTQTVYVVDVPR